MFTEHKEDTDGKALAGAYFTATNTETNEKFVIGPTNSSGYAKSEDKIPYGTYTITETVFPTNYRYAAATWGAATPKKVSAEQISAISGTAAFSAAVPESIRFTPSSGCSGAS